MDRLVDRRGVEQEGDLKRKLVERTIGRQKKLWTRLVPNKKVGAQEN